MYFVMLFDKISCNLRILCFYNGIIVNTENDITYNGRSHEFLTATLDDITYNGRSHEFLTATLDMSLNNLSRMFCD